MTQVKDLVSIIVPVFNLGDSIIACFNSIRRQTYTKIEILFIDDGSEDNSLEICEKCAEMDERVHLCHQTNQGVSAARNKGLEFANGEYIAFIDGDDIVAPFYVERLVKEIKGKGLSICTHQIIHTYDYLFENTAESAVLINAKECALRVLQGTFPVSVWGAVFRRDMIGELRFKTGIKNNEDKLFLFSYLINNSGSIVAFINQKMYGYFFGGSSASRRKWNNNYDLIVVADEMKRTVETDCPAWLGVATNNSVRARLNTIQSIMRSGQKSSEINKTLKALRNEILNCHIQAPLSLQMRIELAVLRMGTTPYKLLVFSYNAMFSEKIRSRKNERRTYFQDKKRKS